MTELEERAKTLSKEEIDILYNKIDSLDMTEEEYCLFFIAKEKASESKAKKCYQVHRGLLGNAISACIKRIKKGSQKDSLFIKKWGFYTPKVFEQSRSVSRRNIAKLFFFFLR